jgi:hypothetical protein
MLFPYFRLCSESLHWAWWPGVSSAGSPPWSPARAVRAGRGLVSKRSPDPVRRGGNRLCDGVGSRANRMLGGYLVDVEINWRSVRLSF